MEVKEDVYKDVQEIFGRIILWKKKTFETRICVWLIIYAQIYSIFLNTHKFFGGIFSCIKYACIKNINGKKPYLVVLLFQDLIWQNVLILPSQKLATF